MKDTKAVTKEGLEAVSKEAREIYEQSDVIDLHVDSFIWKRLSSYNLKKRHSPLPIIGPNFRNHIDFPRLRQAKMTGAMWSITTNPFRSAANRKLIFTKNLQAIKTVFQSAPEDFEIVRTKDEYQSAKKSGKHGVFLSIQGGNCFGDDLSGVENLTGDIVRVTLLHLTPSVYGSPSNPFPFHRPGGLTTTGKDFVKALNSKKIFVDLAHINRQGFKDAVAVHDKSQPIIVTHTGIDAVCKHWRNLEDDQLKMIADTGGVIGVMFQKSFLNHSSKSQNIESVIDHLEHIVNTVGEDFAALGSDFDGMIMPPNGISSCLDFPKIAQAMLDRKWQPTRIQKILGGNYLRSLKLLRN